MLLLLAFPLTARAAYLNLTGWGNARKIAELSVEDDRVRVALEIFIQDIATFIELLPEKVFRESEVTPSPDAARMEGSSKETFQIVIGESTHLQAELKLSERRMRKGRFSPVARTVNPYTRKPIPGPPEDKRGLFAELVYPSRRRPDSLTIIPPLEEERDRGEEEST